MACSLPCRVLMPIRDEIVVHGLDALVLVEGNEGLLAAMLTNLPTTPASMTRPGPPWDSG